MFPFRSPKLKIVNKPRMTNRALITCIDGLFTPSVSNSSVDMKTASPPGHVFKTTGTVFKLVREIIGAHCLTKKNAPPPGANVFQPTRTIFELAQDIIGTHLLTKFHDDGP
ncbi:hypothetical protein DPMN_084057 [Dreissena polymorpha]|uniref:Uncharacterized protein n=1 Tax=Dreissena polymorpha TaxID=45954 RepID=A0A9D3YD55_DREPO|nr:hypothetical protein DPMN_084057 [Dreissena polymorpha]